MILLDDHQLLIPHISGPGSQPLDLRTKRRSFSGSPKVYEPLPEEAINETPAIVVSRTDSVVPETKSTDNITVLPNSKNSESPDVFYTPIAQHRQRRRSSIFTCVRLEEYLEYSDDFPSDLATTATTARENSASYEEDPKPIAGPQEKKVSLWNVLSTVFRFASDNLIARIDSHNETTLTGENPPLYNLPTGIKTSLSILRPRGVG